MSLSLYIKESLFALKCMYHYLYIILETLTIADNQPASGVTLHRGDKATRDLLDQFTPDSTVRQRDDIRSRTDTLLLETQRLTLQIPRQDMTRRHVISTQFHVIVFVVHAFTSRG